MQAWQLAAMRQQRQAAGMGGFTSRPAGMGEIDWNGLFNQGFDFGRAFLEQWGARGVARAGHNPYFAPTSGFTPTGARELTPAEAADLERRQREDSLTGGVFKKIADNIGVSPDMLMILLALGVVLFAMPGIQRRGR